MNDRSPRRLPFLVERVIGLVVGGTAAWFGFLTVALANAGNAWGGLAMAAVTALVCWMFTWRLT